MRLFLAGTYCRPEVFQKHKPVYVLESFWYVKPWQIPEIPKYKDFLLDSGAFTFMNGKKADSFDGYLEKYIKFINDHDIKNFFELDVDSITGYEEVKRLRRILENKTGKKSIPVWHKSRGLDEWKRLTENYSYVAIGGFVVKEIQKKEYPFIPGLLDIAKRNGCKVHGLGFTSDEALKMGFYSVDSTNWQSSSRFGGIQYFNGKRMVNIKTPPGKVTKHYLIRDEFIAQEYIKFQKWAEIHL